MNVLKESNPNSRHDVLLIGGAMRSGTTVIHRVLCTAKNSNPYISESWFLSDIMRLYRWNLTRFEVRHADQFGSEENFRELIWQNIRKYISLVSEKYNAPEILVLKHPELTRHFVDLAGNFQNFKFVVIVRDPRDVIASIMRVADRHTKNKISSPQTGIVGMKQHCSNYIAYYVEVMRNMKLFDGRLMFVKYENFMEDPGKELQRISQFGGLQYDVNRAIEFLPEHASAPNFDKKTREADPFSGAFWSDAYTKSLTTDRIGRYKEVLDASQVGEIERYLQKFGNHFNYWQTN